MLVDDSAYAIGIWLYEELDDEVIDELGLYLVEGDRPGSDFVGVKFEGRPDELNAELRRRGINLWLEVDYG